MQPSPVQVAETLRRLLADAWPAHDAERERWFRAHGIAPTRGVGAWRCWGTGIPGWGETTTCWSLDGDDFVGVGWFLWPDHPGAAQAATALHAELIALLGAARPRSGDGGSHWREWVEGEVVVEFSTGSASDPRVQLHVVHQRHATDGLGECAPEDAAAPGSRR